MRAQGRAHVADGPQVSDLIAAELDFVILLEADDEHHVREGIPSWDVTQCEGIPYGGFGKAEYFGKDFL